MRFGAPTVAFLALAGTATAQEAPNPAVIGLRLFSAICLDTRANQPGVSEASESYGLTPGALTDIPTTTRATRNTPSVQIDATPREGTVFRGEVEGFPVVVVQYSRTQGRGRDATTVPVCDLYLMGASETEVAQLVPEDLRDGFLMAPAAFLTLNRRRFSVAVGRISRDSPYAERGALAYFSREGRAPRREGEEQQ